MAYINVAEWSPDMVTDWLKGLDNSMYHYVQSFTNNGVGGKQLLNIRPYELEQLGMHVIGHQEIVLEAVENLKNSNYNLDKENLQFLALHVATAAHSLTKQLEFSDQEKLETAVLKDITRTITHLKALIEWLDRAPFRGQKKFDELRKQCMRFGLEVATVAMRDRFSLMPVQAIRQNAIKLANIGEYIIKDITDPIILQPASLDLVTLKKRESDLGFLIMQSFHGVHRITEIKFNSPAHNSGKVEEGDEIVQINYQTVVGWEYKKVLLQLQESPPDVLLTLKKRPKHIKIYGQIYIKPFRLPSKKRSLPYRWGESLPSPRATDTFALQDFSLLPLDRVPEKHVPSDTESDGSVILTPTDVVGKEAEKGETFRLYLPKPRAVLQRRHTLSSFKDLVGVSSWHERKPLLSSDLQHLRDKSVSFGFGLEMSPRPTTTCLGLVGGGGGAGSSVGPAVQGSVGVPGKCSSFGGLQSSLPDIVPAEVSPPRQADSFAGAPVCAPPNDLAIVAGAANGASGDAYKAGVSKVVRFESSSKADQCHVDTKYTCKVDSTVLETFEPIPYVDEDLPAVPVLAPPTVTERVKRFESFANRTKPSIVTNGQHTGSTSNGVQSATISVGPPAAPGPTPSTAAPLKPIPMQRQLSKEPELAEAINTVVVNREMVKRGRLDKSYSTPAYDDELSDIPPAIEPRKEHLQKAPPVPPPRPKRTLPNVEPGFVSSLSNTLDSRDDNPNKSKLANVIDLKQNRTQPLPGSSPSPSPKPAERTTVPPVPASRPAVPVPMAKIVPTPNESPPPPPVPPAPSSSSSSSSTATTAVPSLPTGDSSSELLTPNKTKSLTLKKKNSLLSKRRNVSLKTLCVSDIQGHLYRRTKDRNGVSYWAKYYFVLIETTLYGFRSKEAPKANSMIFLSGFTISHAKEVHSRPHAFKVYHPYKTFYFAAETQDALVQWMEYIKQATLKAVTLGGGAGGGGGGGGGTAQPTQAEFNAKNHYSETDSSDEELGLMDSTTKLNLLCTPSPQMPPGAGGSHSMAGGNSGTPTSSKPDRFNFGSLKKFTKIGSDTNHQHHHHQQGGGGGAGGGGGGGGGRGTGAADGGLNGNGNNAGGSGGGEGSKFFGLFSSHRNVEKSNSSEMPVPTSQFKSYRKVPGAGGLQIGTASVTPEIYPLSTGATTMMPMTATTMAHAADGGNFSASSLSLASGSSTFTIPAREEKPAAVPPPPPRATTPTPPPPPPVVIIREPPVTPTISEAAELLNRARKTKRISPHNYIHASNPNLVEFDFPTSKAMDFTVPKIHAGNTWDTGAHSHSSNLQSMITLKDLMLQKQAEEAQDMYNKRVCLGVEKLDDQKGGKKGGMSDPQQGHSSSAAAPAIPEAVNKIQRRQLPITPDYAQSFKLDDEDILYTRSKEGQKLRDFGYELISGDDAFDQRNKTNRGGSIGGGGGGVGGLLVGGSSTNAGGNGIMASGAAGGIGGSSSNGAGSSGSAGGGSIKKKTFNWINSGDRKGAPPETADAGGSMVAGSGVFSSSSSSSLSFSTGSSGTADHQHHHRSGLSLRDSFKRGKNKARLDNFKASSEKLFQFKQSAPGGAGSSGGVGGSSSNNNDKESLKTKQLDKPATPGAMVNVNLKHQPQHVPFPAGVIGGGKKNNNELNAALEQHSVLLFQQTMVAGETGGIGSSGSTAAAGGGLFAGGIKKSNTCNSSSDFKENAGKLQNMRKNSAPERGANGGSSGSGAGTGAGIGAGATGGSATSYFTKLSFGSTKTAKEKKLLGSPGLHRAIFGKNHHQHHHGHDQPTVMDHEVFSPISYTKAPPTGVQQFSSEPGTSSTVMPTGATHGTAPLMTTTVTGPTGAILTTNFGPNQAVAPTVLDYPNMEYPPVFEPETYSLSDPSTSLTLLKRRQNHHHPHQPHHHHHHHSHQQK